MASYCRRPECEANTVLRDSDITTNYIPTAVRIKITVFWSTTPCILVNIYGHFRGAGGYIKEIAASMNTIFELEDKLRALGLQKAKLRSSDLHRFALQFCSYFIYFYWLWELLWLAHRRPMMVCVVFGRRSLHVSVLGVTMCTRVHTCRRTFVKVPNFTNSLFKKVFANTLVQRWNVCSASFLCPPFNFITLQHALM